MGVLFRNVKRGSGLPSVHFQ